MDYNQFITLMEASEKAPYALKYLVSKATRGSNLRDSSLLGIAGGVVGAGAGNLAGRYAARNIDDENEKRKTIAKYMAAGAVAGGLGTGVGNFVYTNKKYINDIMKKHKPVADYLAKTTEGKSKKEIRDLIKKTQHGAKITLR